MSEFANEAQAAFREIENEGMPVHYTLTNDAHTGIIRQSVGEAHLTEPGFQPMDQIVIVTTIGQFTQPPDDSAREIVEIVDGPFSGKYTLIGVSPTVTHYELTCAAAV